MNLTNPVDLKFKKILIANRGEIALQIIKTARLLAIETVSIHTIGEENEPHVTEAHHSVLMYGSDRLAPYLDEQQLIRIALRYSCDAIHPGYGFLSEKGSFAQLCQDNDIIFIGPRADIINLMGDKTEARKVASECGLPILKGITGTAEHIMHQAHSLIYPLLIKPAKGGGGKGMETVESPAQLSETLDKASRAALRYFGDASVFVEQKLKQPKHIEVQVLADHQGNVIHLYERDCSIQRRFQKIIEESPSPQIDETLRKRLTDDAIMICQKIGYTNAGTIEFLVDENNNHYFLEMNTRIQVEHPVTEELLNINLIKEQFLIASGAILSIDQSNITTNKHAIECRIYAEDPENNFAPSPGQLCYLKTDSNFRIDSALKSTSTIAQEFDPMIAKVVTQGNSRTEAIDKMKHALKNIYLEGIKTNQHYLINIINDHQFHNGKYSTHFCEEHPQLIHQEKQIKIQPELIIAASLLINKHTENMEKSSIFSSLCNWRHFISKRVIINNVYYFASIKPYGEKQSLILNSQNIGALELISHTDESINFKLNERLIFAQYHTVTTTQQLIVINHQATIVETPNGKATIEKNDTADKDSNRTRLYSPLPGTLTKLLVSEGAKVELGTPLAIVEAMKMENTLTSWKSGTVKKIFIQEGTHTKANQEILEIT